VRLRLNLALAFCAHLFSDSPAAVSIVRPSLVLVPKHKCLHSHPPVVFSLYLFLGIPSTGSCGLLNTIYSFTDESKRSKSPARSAAFPLFF
jgi:hypothetical protein